jgi:hypothetical protein
MKRGDSDLLKEWNRPASKSRRFRLPEDWSWRRDPGGGHLAGATLLLIGLVGLATGHWKFGGFMGGLGLVLLLGVSYVSSHFRRRPRK